MRLPAYAASNAHPVRGPPMNAHAATPQRACPSSLPASRVEPSRAASTRPRRAESSPPTPHAPRPTPATTPAARTHPEIECRRHTSWAPFAKTHTTPTLVAPAPTLRSSYTASSFVATFIDTDSRKDVSSRPRLHLRSLAPTHASPPTPRPRLRPCHRTRPGGCVSPREDHARRVGAGMDE
ncbi:hypothetical protein C8R45DRAFT_1216269 [Mycena sanguinolenta]|nr:hypothetical protein C8R45DRAFT_1216269 [Mycena sanguinolenta]